MYTSACFKIVNKCKISKFARFKFKDFSRIFKYFQAPYLFSSTFKGLEAFTPNSSIFKDFSSTLWTLWKKLVCILALEMASPGNQHCADCIGTVPIVSAHFRSLQQQAKHSYQTPPLLHCCPLVGQFEHMPRCWIHAAPSLNIVSIHLSVSPISGHCL